MCTILLIEFQIPMVLLTKGKMLFLKFAIKTS